MREIPLETRAAPGSTGQAACVAEESHASLVWVCGSELLSALESVSREP
jgi:hypothetical protein